MTNDTLTTVLGVVLAILTVISTNLQVANGGPLNWWGVAIAALIAGIGYLTNKATPTTRAK